MSKTLETFYVVYQHDQGRTDEMDSFTTRAAARHWIQDRNWDMSAHPQWYRHLANPSYSIEVRKTWVEEPFFSPCMNYDGGF